MSKDTIATITGIAFVIIIALEAFMIGRTREIDNFLSVNSPRLYSVFNEILIVVTIGFFIFFLLGVAALSFDKEREQ